MDEFPYLAAHDFSNPTHRAEVDFSHENETDLAGLDELVKVFERHYRRGLHSAAQLVVLRRGQVLLDRAIGTLRRGGGAAVTPHTPFLVFSATKPFAAMAIHKLIEEGRVEWDAPVARYWPEWGQRGKETAAIRHVLNHQSGIGQPHLNRQALLWPNWQRVTADVARTAAEYAPGTECAYQTVNFGFILGEVIRRVTGMDAGSYIRRTILEPLGMRDSALPISRRGLAASPRLYAAGKTYQSAAMVFGIPAIRTALMPAATLHASARDLAVFYQMLLNGGEYNGTRLFAPETIANAIAPAHTSFDRTLGLEITWANGFQIMEQSPAAAAAGYGSSPSTFAHYGIGTCMAWADWRAQVVVAFTCNTLLEPPGPDARWAMLNNAVWDALLGVEPAQSGEQPAALL